MGRNSRAKNMTVLITGATGLLGEALIATDAGSHTILGGYLGEYAMKNARSVRYACVDICDEHEMAKLFRGNDIDIVIHTAGVADVDLCERHYDAAYSSNVTGTKAIVELCADAGAKLVYISTNAVFDGTKAPYREDDLANPINKYGEMKIECEKMVSKHIKNFLIIRPILMYGWNNENERDNLVTSLLKKLPKQETVNMVTDIYDNPLSAHHCACVIWELLEKNKTGIYHVAGKDIVNRYEYALAIAEVFNLDRSLIKPVNSNFFPNIAPRPKNTSYDTSKLEKDIGFRPLGLREGLLLMKDNRPRR
ncbi:MAG: SDR family oxidoreductase [Candidatus Omnitrophica bacterium]|nr:SDR family oxidoreductase [Candidatus Omnitrophota bacterium]